MKKMFRSKNRVLTAISHKTPDRVPYDLSVVPEVADRMCEFLRVGNYQEVLKHLGIDIRYIFGICEGPLHHSPRKTIFQDGTWQDVWGVIRKTVPNVAGGAHEEVISYPLANTTSVTEIIHYPWPTAECYKYDHIELLCQKNKEFALIGGYAHFFCPGADLRGYGSWLMDLAEDSTLAYAMLEKMEEFWLDYSTRIYEAAKGMLDIFYIADDYGMQEGMLISPDCWRKMFKPIIKRFIDLAHKRGMYTMLHSCGSIKPIISELVECGLDILNPIQPLARDMNPYKLKKEFGKDLCFHGGVDIQRLLPFGTVNDVRDEVHRLIETLGQNGGYILSPAHQVQADVPAENVIAIFT